MKIGELVQLKSGGPVMTVVKIDDVNHISCMWYASQAGEYRTQMFTQSVLDEVELDDDDDDDED
jgi:uncharacterized protein YodC (DUF2158 family)